MTVHLKKQAVTLCKQNFFSLSNEYLHQTGIGPKSKYLVKQFYAPTIFYDKNFFLNLFILNKIW